MGTMHILAATSGKSGGNPAFTFIILAVLVGLFYLLIMRPQRNRQRKAMQTQSQVVPGQRIRTTSGMYGTVVSGDERDVVVEVSPGVQVTMLRRAIMDVVSDDAATGGATPTATDAGYEAPSEDGQGTSTDQFGDLKDRNS